MSRRRKEDDESRRTAADEPRRAAADESRRAKRDEPHMREIGMVRRRGAPGQPELLTWHRDDSPLPQTESLTWRPGEQPLSEVVVMERGRDWAFYVQALGLVGFWGFALTVVAWFVWRGYELARYGDIWQPAIGLGAAIGTVFVTFASVMTYLFLKLGAASRQPAPNLPLEPMEEILTDGVLKPWSLRFKAIVAGLVAVFAWGVFCWFQQARHGLGITGLGRPVFWGLYITDFVFFIGISHAGTLVSAILRMAQAEWRRAITRAAEVITVMVLFFGAWSILLDMGRLDRMLNVFASGRLQSPLLWDVCSITTYLTASTLYLYLPLIPDIALLRKRVHGIRRPLYHLLSFGWTGTHDQKKVLERAIGIMAVLVLPIAVSVHTVVSWVFSMTVQPMWHSTIFGPYFVVGAIFSGIAALLIAMAIVRRHLHLENFLRPVHFNYMGLLLLVMACLWFYFTSCEYVTTWFGDEPVEVAVMHAKLSGRFAIHFWTMVGTCFVIPVAILARKRTRTVAGTVVAGLSVCIGMWLERYTIIVPTLERPRLAFHTAGDYFPTWVEWSLMGGAFAGFILMYVLFTRLFPIVSIWEVREGRQEAQEEVAERVRGYLPVEPSGTARERHMPG